MKKISRICSIVFIICATGIMIYTASVREQQKQMQEEYARLAEEQAAEASAAAAAAEEAETAAETVLETEEALQETIVEEEADEMSDMPVLDKEVDIAALQESTNKDIYAWIYIPDNAIDYPVLQHDTDNSYYLNYNIDGSKGYPGCIYTENYNAKDFSDPNTVMYGHNMKNGSMFAGLHDFEDEEYFKEHPYVYIFTEKGILTYEIFAAYQYSNAHILFSYDFTNKAVFQKYIEDIFDYNGNFNTEVEVTAESNILTLSTCVANQANKRYLVQAVLKETYDYSEEDIKNTEME